jgi:hypothetical protein
MEKPVIENKQTLSPAEWKSVSDHLLELSEKVQQASGPNTQNCEPRHKSAASTEVKSSYVPLA